MVGEILGHSRVESLANELSEKPESKGQDGSYQRSLGAFQHGGIVGLSTLSRSHPELVQKVCQLIRRDHSHQTYEHYTVEEHVFAVSPGLPERSKLHELSFAATGAELECGDAVVSGAFGHRLIDGHQLR